MVWSSNNLISQPYYTECLDSVESIISFRTELLKCSQLMNPFLPENFLKESRYVDKNWYINHPVTDNKP